MIDGPFSAPSSPPEMPAPTKWMPVSRTAFSRRMVSVNSGVAAVDDDVARLEHLDQLVDDGVGARAGLHHDDRGARLRERGGELVVGLRRRRSRPRGAR